MAGHPCIVRLQKELKLILKEPVPYIRAKPNPSDLLEWHYVLEGSAGTPYEGGFYHGKLKFSEDYPFKPPSIYMITSTGRFATNMRICMSMSDYHPETWNPVWSVSSILIGLLSFMMEKAETAGSIVTSDEEKRRLAKVSLEYNCKRPIFRKLFPELLELHLSLLGRTEGQAHPQETVKISEAGIRQGNIDLNVSTKSETTQIMRKASLKKEDSSVKLPFWATALIVLFCACILALPLLVPHQQQQ